MCGLSYCFVWPVYWFADRGAYGLPKSLQTAGHVEGLQTMGYLGLAKHYAFLRVSKVCVACLGVYKSCDLSNVYKPCGLSRVCNPCSLPTGLQTVGQVSGLQTIGHVEGLQTMGPV